MGSPGADRGAEQLCVAAQAHPGSSEPAMAESVNAGRWRGVCILVSAPVLCRRGAIAACPSMTPGAVGQSSVLC